MLTLWFLTGFLASSEATEPPVETPVEVADGVYSRVRKSARTIEQDAEEWRGEKLERKQAVEAAWAKVFGEDPSEPAQPSMQPGPQPSTDQKKQIAAIAARQLAVTGIEETTDRLIELIDAYAAEIALQDQVRKRNRDAMILLLMAA
jgi:hypothetical protein